MTPEDNWPTRWNELIEDLERQRQALHCEQERWAEWHAIQEQALMDQIRLVEQRETDLVRRELILADALRALEQDAIVLDERHELLQQERKFLQDEMKQFHEHLVSPDAIRSPHLLQKAYPRKSIGKRQSSAHYVSRTFMHSPEADEDDDDDEDENWYSRPTEHLRKRSSPGGFETRSPPEVALNRRASFAKIRKNRQHQQPPGSPPAHPSDMGAFEVRVNSPDNTRVHVSYMDPRATGHWQRQQLMQSFRPRSDPQPGSSAVTSNYGKVAAGIQASESIKSKIKTLREAVLPGCGISEIQREESDQESRNIKVTDIVRTITPKIMSSSTSGERAGGPSANTRGGGASSSQSVGGTSSLEHRLSKFYMIDSFASDNIVAKIDR